MVYFLEKLNKAQREAVMTTEGHVRVIAGAGTGKTRTLTHRFCFITAGLGVAPQNILCVTFTNRAANEMKRRIREMTGDQDLALICTFHAFCARLLKEDINAISYPDNFIIIDNEDQKQILAKVFEDMGLSMRETTIRDAMDMIEGKKMQASGYIDYICSMPNGELREKALSEPDRNDAIFLRYLYEQKKSFGCDFNDLINFATHILEHCEPVRQKWQDRMQYVMVDEFQDVSEKQYKIAKILSAKHGNLFVVGDPDQTIYFWRGSRIKFVLNFDKQYPDAVTIPLTQNYRSTPAILTAANALISRNSERFQKDLTAVKSGGAKPLYFHAKSPEEETGWIVDRIAELREKGAPLSSIAVLYRAHYLSRALEEGLIASRIPYKIFSGVEFYGRREIRDAVCYLRMATAADDLAFLRTVNSPPRKIGKKRMEELRRRADNGGISLYEALKESTYAGLLRGTGAAVYMNAIEYVRGRKGEMAPADAMQTLLDMSGYEDALRASGDQERLDNLAELKRSLVSEGLDNETTIEDFLERVALFTNLDREEQRDSVRLMTIHTSKGMEFPHVFICGLSEGVFPSRRIKTPEEMEEERRIAYVAMTRAMDDLFLSDSEGVANDNVFKYPSRFVFDAGLDNLELAAGLDASLIERAVASPRHDEAETVSFPVSARVSHPLLGEGTVLAVDNVSRCYLIRFDKLKTERSIRFDAGLVPVGGPPLAG